MLSVILFSEVKGLQPLGKYFLVRFFQCFGVADPVGLGVKTLAKQFGLSDSQVSEALAALIACGVMSFSSISEGRGRPKRSYQLTDHFLKRLSKAVPQPVPQHEEMVDGLLRHENWKAAERSDRSTTQKKDVGPLASIRDKRQPDRLSAVNRLLLSVLLCSADRIGVVTDLGYSTLRKVTGLSTERLRNRVQRLIDQGFVRVYVPGATSALLSAKQKGTYFLNLNHPQLSIEGDVTSIFICTMTYDPSESARDAQKIYKDVTKLKHDPNAFDNRPSNKWLRFFGGQPLPFFRLLQVILEKYSADMLSMQWNALGPCAANKWAHVEEWKARVRKDFRLSDQEGHLMHIDAGEQSALVDDLHYSAYVLATRIKTLLSQASNISFEAMDFVIIPQPMGRAYCDIAVLARSRDANGWVGGLYVKPYAESQPFSFESDICLEGKYRVGLLTRPSGEAIVA